MKGEKTGGRKKGTPNSDNKITRGLLQDLVSNRLDDFNECLDKLKTESPKDFSNVIVGLLPYTVPKLSSVELTGDEKKPLSILVTKTYDKK